MNKLSYKLSYIAACCLRDYSLKASRFAMPTAANILAATVLAGYYVALSRKLVVKYHKPKTISLSYSDALAIYILSSNQSINAFEPLEIAVIQPIMKDVESKIILSPEFKLDA